MGVTSPKLERKVFNPTSSRGEARDFRQELGDSLPCPTPPQGSDDPYTHTLVATPPKEIRLWPTPNSPCRRRG
jgi:hypothetical protein